MKYHSLDYKLSAIKYYKKVKNYSLVSRIFGCNTIVANIIINFYLKKNMLFHH